MPTSRRCRRPVAPSSTRRMTRSTVSESEHLDDRAHADRMAKVVRVDAAGEGWSSGPLGRDEARLRVLALQPVADEWIGEPREVGASAYARDDNVRISARHLHLLLGLEADHRLVQEGMVH